MTWKCYRPPTFAALMGYLIAVELQPFLFLAMELGKEQHGQFDSFAPYVQPYSKETQDFARWKTRKQKLAFLLYRFFGRKKFRNEKIRNRFNRIEIKTPMITCECSPQPMLDNQLGSPNLHPKNQGHDSQHQWRSLQRPKQQHQPN